MQIFIEGIPETATDDDVRAVAEEFGPVSVEIVLLFTSVGCQWSVDDRAVVLAQVQAFHLQFVSFITFILV